MVLEGREIGRQETENLCMQRRTRHSRENVQDYAESADYDCLISDVKQRIVAAAGRNMSARITYYIHKGL